MDKLSHWAAIWILLYCATSATRVFAQQRSLVELENYALTHAGDAERGRKLFQDVTRTKCGLCHQVSGQKRSIGPNLSSIGGKFDRPHLIESLLQPNRQIVEGYWATRLLTSDGQVLTGIRQDHPDGSVSVFDANAQEHRVAGEDIERSEQLENSLMPTGLADLLSEQEFCDMIAYLESLRPGGNRGAGSQVAGPYQLPPGFELRTLATGLTGATALACLEDGRVFVCEQTGSVRVIQHDQLLEQPLLTLPVNHEWERGVIGVTVDPDFAHQPWVYVCWTADQPYPHHRVSRFLVEGNQADLSSEQVLLVGDDQGQMGGKVPAGHQGGALHFGADGKLYIAIGEQTAGAPAQALDTFLGKILRINADGTLPEDNPLRDRTHGKYQAIWAYGMRNPFTFAVRPGDGLMLINDVGGKYEEINVGLAGRNYGWPIIPHGPAEDARFEDPIHWYPEASINGGDFLPEDAGWPDEFRGRYFFADFKHGWVRTIDPEQGQAARAFASGIRRPVDLRFDGQQRLLLLLRNAWVIDDKFQAGTSSLIAIGPKSQSE